MYADRYGIGPRIRPVSTTLAAAMTVLPIVALVLGLQISQKIVKPGTITWVPVEEPKPPEPDPVVKKQPQQPIDRKIYVPPLPQPVPVPHDFDTTIIKPVGPVEPPTLGKGDVIEPIKPEPVVIKAPVMVNAQIDSRSALQPPYPPEEIRAERSGRVSVRVLIGADGRVKQVARVSATSDYFYAAAEKQALNKWRFKPATKDGVAIEQWKVMNLSFVLSDL